MDKKYLINHQIKASKILLLGAEGEKLGETTFRAAIEKAMEQDLDLMQVGENGDIAICKILKYDSFLYHEKKKKEKQDFKNRAHDIKIIQLRPVTGSHDFELKMKKVSEFLEDNHKVKIVIKFKSFRETTMTAMNEEIVQKVMDYIKDIGELDGKLNRGGKEINFYIKVNKKQPAPKPKM